jgi:16S rRNA (cytidine1402-2'-O)-methyltransferase
VTADPPENPSPSGATGALVLVGTPIGNLGDLSPRAVEVLRTADVIACEDTRRTRHLLTAAGVPAGGRLMAVHDHNEAAQVGGLLTRLAAGQRVAVVTDAGMPGISDPGERLVAAAAAAGHLVEVVPGPSAAVAALVVSGLPTGRWCFEGFLPRKGRDRARRLAELASERRTTVLFESPRRVHATVADLAQTIGGQRRVAVARELTKKFEEVWRGTLAEAVEHLAGTESLGEYVLVIEGAPEREPATESDVEAALRARLATGMPKRDAVAEVAADLDVPKRQVYDAALRLVEQQPGPLPSPGWLPDDGSGLMNDEHSRRRRLLDDTRKYLAELGAEVGEPSPEEVADAEALLQRILRTTSSGSDENTNSATRTPPVD